MFYLNEGGSSVFVAAELDLTAAEDRTVELESMVTAKVSLNDDHKISKVVIVSDTLAALQAIQKARRNADSSRRGQDFRARWRGFSSQVRGRSMLCIVSACSRPLTQHSAPASAFTFAVVLAGCTTDACRMPPLAVAL